MLSAHFQNLKSKQEGALVLFVTAGDPSLDALPNILEALADAGADVLEIGIPFSDPIADGPTIQASSQRALDRGVRPSQVLEALSKAQVSVPRVLMGYYNPVLNAGLDAFARDAKAAGASGTIISDLTPDEAGEWIQVSKTHGLDNIFLAAPTSTDARLKMACSSSSGFVYAVARTGVTGANANLSPESVAFAAKVRSYASIPVCMGFGISSAEHVRAVCQVADGAVIGSWLVQRLATDWDDAAKRNALLQEVRMLKAATRS